MLSRITVTIAVVSMFACGNSEPPGIRVTSQEFGNLWRFTIAEGKLLCETDRARKLILLDTGNGIQYGINGSAREFGFPDGRSILKDGFVLANLQPFIDRGLTLCK